MSLLVRLSSYLAPIRNVNSRIVATLLGLSDFLVGMGVANATNSWRWPNAALVEKSRLPQQWQWLNSQTAAQSQAIRLWIVRAESPEQLRRLVRGLAQRQEESCGSYDNAQALMALGDYVA